MTVHSLTIIPSLGSPAGSGAAYFRVDTAQSVPESSSTLSLLALGVLGTGSQMKRKQQRQVQNNSLN